MSESIIRIYFNQFWGGFIEGTDSNKPSFFIELFIRVFGSLAVLDQNIDTATILCENAWCSIEESLIDRKKWKATFIFTGESTINLNNVTDEKHKHWQRFSCMLSGLANNKELRRVQCPLMISYLFCNPQLHLSSVEAVPQQMACAIISNPQGMIRNKFLDRLEAHMPIVYGGNFRCNIDHPISGGYNSNTLINHIKKFKFVITMENSEEEYYITEKICNGLFAGVIPIYWGSPRISEYIHSERFLHLKNGSDEECDRLVQQMKHMDDATYVRMVQSPVFIHDIHTMIQKIANDISSLIF
jgi:hypothetical protein